RVVLDIPAIESAPAASALSDRGEHRAPAYLARLHVAGVVKRTDAGPGEDNVGICRRSALAREIAVIGAKQIVALFLGAVRLAWIALMRALCGADGDDAHI